MQLFKPSECALLILNRTRNSNRSRVVCDCSYGRLFDPPDGVGGKLISTPEVELLHGPHQADGVRSRLLAGVRRAQQVDAAAVWLVQRDHWQVGQER